jgi:hypothetical protein
MIVRQLYRIHLTYLMAVLEAKAVLEIKWFNPKIRITSVITMVRQLETSSWQVRLRRKDQLIHLTIAIRRVGNSREQWFQWWRSFDVKWKRLVEANRVAAAEQMNSSLSLSVIIHAQPLSWPKPQMWIQSLRTTWFLLAVVNRTRL